MRLADKVVVITGAGSGLGRECSLLFADEGAKVVITDINTDRCKRVAEEVIGKGGSAVGVRADVTVESDMAAAVAAAVERFGRIDVMFANAGVPEEGFGAKAFESTTLDQFRRVVDVCLLGVFLACKHAVIQMKRQGTRGTIVVTTSASSLVSYPGFPSYAAAKAGANGLVRSMALDLGRHGIRANALCPTHGMSINFAMEPNADVLGKSYEEMSPWDPDQRAMPLRLDRPPRIRDNANLALFLASDESAYMSGVCIPATDGGTLARVAMEFPVDLGEDGSTVLPSDG